jgi:hypothetical protein
LLIPCLTLKELVHHAIKDFRRVPNILLRVFSILNHRPVTCKTVYLCAVSKRKKGWILLKCDDKEKQGEEEEAGPKDENHTQNAFEMTYMQARELQQQPASKTRATRCLEQSIEIVFDEAPQIGH